MGSRIPRRLLSHTLVGRLAEIEGLTVYLRRVGFVLGVTDQPGGLDVPPPTVSDRDKRVRPYVVVYPTVGSDGPDDRLCRTRTGLVWQPQITCVVGDEDALDVVVDAVTGVLDGWRPAFAAPHDGVDVGRFRQLAGYDPGPSRRDDDVTPARFWTPLIYQLPVYS